MNRTGLPAKIAIRSVAAIGPLGIIDLGSGADLALDPATGTEPGREVAEDVAATIGPLFDVIATSAASP